MSIGKIIIGIIFLTALVGLTIYKPNSQQIISVAPPVFSDKNSEVVIDGSVLSYVLFTASPESTRLIANFDKKISSAEISSKYGCLYGINGSFYNENFEPLAGWETDYEVRKNITHNNLLNGYLGIGVNNSVWLGKNIPQEKMKWGMQSGPVLISSGNVETLSMATDKPARRSVAGLSRSGKLIFFSIFLSNSRYDGPKMEILPKVIEAISTNENLDLINAVNLDGGSASAFYSPTDKLPELVTVGSWICVN